MKRKFKIVLISGRQGSGKSTLSYNLRAWAINNSWVFSSVKFADPLYEMHYEVLSILRGYGRETPSKDGVLLQMLGTEWGRKQYGDDIWASLARNKVDSIIKRWVDAVGTENIPVLIVIDDCRFMNELLIFPEAIKIRLECARDERKERAVGWRDNEFHASETQFDNIDLKALFDFVFDTGVGGLSPDRIVNIIADKCLS